MRRGVRIKLGNLILLGKAQFWLFVLIALGIVMRIPRVSGIIGNDAFAVIWMGRVVFEGALDNWQVTPFSLFGMYPFASYPIGIPALLAILFHLGFNYEAAVILISMASSVVGAVGAYHLGNELSGKTRLGLGYATFYSLSHLFVGFTYFTVSTRGPFMALLPFLVRYGVAFLRRRKKSDLMKALSLWGALLLIHPLAIFIMLYVLVALGYVITKVMRNDFLGRTQEAGVSTVTSSETPDYSLVQLARTIMASAVDRVRKVDTFLFLMSMGAAFLIGLLLLPFDQAKTTPFILTNDTPIGMAMNLLIDYGIRLGILSIFFPIGLLFGFRESSYSGVKFLHLILGMLMAFTLPTSLYTSVLLFPVFAYYSVSGFCYSRKWLSDSFMAGGLLVFLLVFSAIYNFYIVTLPAWVLLLVVSTAITYAVITLAFPIINGLSSKQIRHKKRVIMGFIVLLIVTFSLLCTEGVHLQGESKSITEDEIAIIDILQNYPDDALTFVWTIEVGRRLQAYGIPAIGAFYEDPSLYFGWIEPEEIIAGSYFDIGFLLTNGRLFSYDGRRPERLLFSSLIHLDLTNEDNYTIAYDLGLRFVIVEKGPHGFRDTFHAVGGEVPSLLLQTAPQACEMIYNGPDMALFRLL